MSSSTYSVCLTPDRRLRRLVDRSGIGFAVLGVALIWQLPQADWILLSASIGWMAIYTWQLRRLRRGWHRCIAIRATPGPLFEVQAPDGEWALAELEPGSF